MVACECKDVHKRKRVVLTGGPGAGNHQNPLRTESAAMAAEVDARIASAWATHPRRFMVESSVDFLDKAARALEILRQELPECCRHHVVPALQHRPVK